MHASSIISYQSTPSSSAYPAKQATPSQAQQNQAACKRRKGLPPAPVRLSFSILIPRSLSSTSAYGTHSEVISRYFSPDSPACHCHLHFEKRGHNIVDQATSSSEGKVILSSKYAVIHRACICASTGFQYTVLHAGERDVAVPKKLRRHWDEEPVKMERLIRSLGVVRGVRHGHINGILDRLVSEIGKFL